MKKFIIGLVLMLLVFSLMACDPTTAQPNPDEYEVVFLNHDGTVISRQLIEKGSTAIAPKEPTKEGYIFVGWNQDYTYINSSRVLEPQFQPREFSIIFEVNGGSYIETYTAPFKNPIPIREIETTKEGAIFLGWYYDAFFNEPAVDLYVHPFMPSENITLYAKWSEIDGIDLSYRIINNEAIIDFYGGSKSHLEIPSHINGYPVVKISQYAFHNQLTLESISLPSSLRTIEAYAFSGAKNLETITLEDNTHLHHVGFKAFDQTAWMRNQDHQLILNGLLFGFKHDFYTVITLEDEVHSILSHAFTEAPSVKTLYISDSVQTINQHAFYNHPSLERIYFNESSQLEFIEDYAFAKTKLESIEIPASVRIIKDYAFYDTSLKSVTFAEETKLEYLGEYIFKDNHDLETINFPNTLYYIPVGFLMNTPSLLHFEIPSHVERINYQAFKYSLLQTDFFIPSSVIKIEGEAFMFNLGIKSITFESEGYFTIIQSDAFIMMESLREVILPNHPNFVDDMAFSYNTRLTMVYVTKESVLGQRVFLGSNLTHVFIEEGSDTSTYSRYWNQNNEPLKIYENVIGFDHNESFKFIQLTEETVFIYCVLTNEDVVEIPNTLHGKSVTHLGPLLLFELENVNAVILPNSITYLGNFVFVHDNLESVSFPEDSVLTKIPYYAFAFNEKMVEITLPASIEIIEEFAFSNTLSLESVYFTDDNQLKMIYPFAFSNNKALKTVYFGENTTLNTIGAYAFSDNINLESIYIPLSVIYIEFFAFSNTPNLTISTDYSSKPVTWDQAWNPDHNEVLWYNE